MALTDLTDFQRPDTIDAALSLRSEWGERALVVAGGTFIHGLSARGLLDDIGIVIDISALGLDAIAAQSNSLKVGATATYGALKVDDTVCNDPRYGAIADAMSYPPPQILNVATIGGCLAASCPLFDLPTATSAIGGKIEAVGKTGTRKIAFDDFFTGLFESELADDELVSAIELEPGKSGTSGFAKLETNANDLAIINAAVSLTFKKGMLSRKLTCTGARVYVGGGVGETICRLPSVEAALSDGEDIDAAKIAAAAALSMNDVEAQADHRASAEYRQRMITVFVAKAAERALARAE